MTHFAFLTNARKILQSMLGCRHHLDYRKGKKKAPNDITIFSKCVNKGLAINHSIIQEQ